MGSGVGRSVGSGVGRSVGSGVGAVARVSAPASDVRGLRRRTFGGLRRRLGCRRSVGSGVGRSVGSASARSARVGVGSAWRASGMGCGWIHVSSRLSLVSRPFRSSPSGSRSSEDPAGWCLARLVPRPRRSPPYPTTASRRRRHPTTRRTRVPPAAASPPLQVPSASDANAPASLASRRLPPGPDDLLLPARLAGDRATGGRHVDQLQAPKVGGEGPAVMDLDPLIRGARTASHDLADDQVRRRTARARAHLRQHGPRRRQTGQSGLETIIAARLIHAARRRPTRGPWDIVRPPGGSPGGAHGGRWYG